LDSSDVVLTSRPYTVQVANLQDNDKTGIWWWTVYGWAYKM